MDWISSLLLATVRLAIPLLLISLAELYGQRAGMVNIGLEGLAAIGALVGFLACYITGSNWLGLLCGALAGLLLNQLEIYFHSRSKRMSLSVAFVLLTVGLSMVSFEVGPIHCSFSLLLVCMMTGTVFCNICPTSDELMDRLDRWVSPVNILFFVLSGAELDLNILANPMVLLIGAVYIASRSLGKISGSYVSCKATRCSEKIQKYLGITLLPQAGVALGMAAEAAELSDGHMVRNVVLFSVLVYELVGPTLAKLSLTAAGEIIPEGRTSARTTNKPEEPVSVE